MANSNLRNTKFPVPNEVLDHCREIIKNYGDSYKNYKGHKRLTNLLNKEYVTYEQLKRIKNFFDNFDGKTNEPSYIMNGGDTLKNWVENKLSRERKNIEARKRRNERSGQENQYKDPHEKDNNNDKKIQKTSIPQPQKSANDIMFNDNENLEEQKIFKLIKEINNLKKVINYG